MNDPIHRPRRRVSRIAALALAGLVGATSVPALQTFMPVENAHAAQQAAPAHGFADLVEKVMPAVFSVEVRLQKTAGTELEFDGNVPDMFQNLPEMFRNLPDMFQNRERKPGQRGMPRAMGQGSGFFISADGYAVTNNHVIKGADKVIIKLADGQTYDAKVVGTDPKTDLALLKAEGADAFPYVEFADKPARVGDWVVAVGNPFGLGGTVTTGIVSAQGRDIGSGPYDDYLQIDAPINRGNSGGPAFDLDGKVIGVNTAIFSPSGGSVGIGFAIPVEMVRDVVAELKDTGSVTRGWLGVQIQPVSKDIAESIGLDRAGGALIAQITPRSPAADSSLRAGDVITALNGDGIDSPRDLARKVATVKPGETVTFDVFRNGKARKLEVEIGTMPAGDRVAEADSHGTMPPQAAFDDLGLALAPADDGEGVAVTDVAEGSPAAEKGLAAGDVILEVAGVALSEPEALEKAIAQHGADGQKSVLVLVRKGDSQRFITLPTARG